MAKHEGISVELGMVLSEFTRELDDITAKNVSKAAKQCKRDLKANSPKATGEYAAGWTVRTKRHKRSVDAEVFNRTKPGLTHLLEYSHPIRNADGTYSRTGPGHGQVVHIKPAADAAEEYLIELMMNSIE